MEQSNHKFQPTAIHTQHKTQDIIKRLFGSEPIPQERFDDVLKRVLTKSMFTD